MDDKIGMGIDTDTFVRIAGKTREENLYIVESIKEFISDTWIMNISFIGLGKLGLPLACCLAESGNKVIGIDKNQYFIEKLNNQELPFY